ncbi:MAG: DNA-processing protein DprA [Opitutales bacterium]|nr:DNA-processing protein DprA [Opitutales bacterium]MCH8539189.1 DNA-processing protein DprA [Opitutales bacterium]
MTSPVESERDAFLILNALPHIGPITVNRLLEAVEGHPQELFRVSDKVLRGVRGVGEVMVEALRHWPKHFSLEKEIEKLAQYEVEFITCHDARYPPLLRNIPDPPLGLYAKGPLTVGENAVAIVGSRRTTLYGQKMAGLMAEGLAHKGWAVVSGMARGIDTAAHQGALRVKGPTVAVMGCGLDRIYPPENRELFAELGKSALICSEYPFGRPADRQTFPMRNRIVAGMSRGLVVVESDSRGGSMITAKFAEDQNRQVFALPGRVDQSSSRGCLQLIRDGAVLVRSAEDILEDLEFSPEAQGLLFPEAGHEPTPPPEAPVQELSEAWAQAILDCFAGGEALSLEGIVKSVGEPLPKVSTRLLRLEMKGFLKKRLDGRYERC